MFSTSNAKTFPFASLAMHAGGSKGRTRMMGPAKSVGASTETQESSSSMAREAGGPSFPVASGTVARAREEGSSKVSKEDDGALRFLDLEDFLSPLNVSCVGIFRMQGRA